MRVGKNRVYIGFSTIHGLGIQRESWNIASVDKGNYYNFNIYFQLCARRHPTVSTYKGIEAQRDLLTRTG